MIKRKLTVALVTATIGFATSVLIATPASATESRIACNGNSNAWHFTADGVRIHIQESASSRTLGYGYNGQRFCVDTRGGYFVHGTNEVTGVTGWAHVDFLSI